MKVLGKIRGMSLFYSDGTERVEIWVPKVKARNLPYREGRRVPISLTIGSETFFAGLRATTRCDQVWICPNMTNQAGEKVRLADALSGFEKNESVELVVSGNAVRVRKAQH